MAFREQWEIDLRKQLEGKFTPTNNNTEITWEDKLKKEIDVTPKKSNTLLFIILLIFLGLAIIFAYDQKTGGRVETWINSQFDIQNAPVCENMPQEEIEKPRREIKDIKDNDTELLSIKNSIAKLEEANKANEELMKKTSDRVTLMGVLLNENFMIVRNNYDRSHLIFFNRDWTLDRMPSYIKFSEEDREFLKKYTREN